MATAGQLKDFKNSQFYWMSYWRGSVHDVVICPYDFKHIMTYRRLQIHIINCQKNFEAKHPEVAKNVVICPYSTLHRFPKDKLEEHLKECKEHIMSVHSRVTAGKAPYIKPIVDGQQKKVEDQDFDAALVAEWNDLLKL